jgi:hypothetical protein
MCCAKTEESFASVELSETTTATPSNPPFVMIDEIAAMARFALLRVGIRIVRVGRFVMGLGVILAVPE